MADKIFMLQDALRLVMARGKMLPSTKPRYRLLEELANGGFSQVWLARDLESKTRPYVAIKCCQGTPDAYVSSEVTILRKIRSRAASASQPGASNILTLIDDFVIQAPGPPVAYHQCLVTELVIPLIDWIQELSNRFHLTRQLVDAFSFLHSQGIVHGDPHEGNLGIAIKGLENVPEDKLLAQLGDDRNLLCILDNLQDDEDVACGQLIPEDAHDVELKVYDFGKSYEIETSRTSDTRGVPEHDLPGVTPTAYRSPEVDLYELSGGKVGCNWSLGCDVWALGSLLYWISRTSGFVPIYGKNRSEEYRLAARCQPGGAPPREWLDHCDMGPSVLLCLRELQAKQEPTGGAEQGEEGQEPPSLPTSPSSPSSQIDDKQWILKHMQWISDEFWRKKSVKQPWEDADFAVAEFCQMVRSMMILDDSKRASISLVAAHEFWRASGFGDGNPLVEGSSS